MTGKSHPRHSRSVVSAALFIAILFGCGSQSPVEVKPEITAFSQATIPFSEVENYPPGKKMNLQINRYDTEVSTVEVTFKGTYVNGDERLIIAEAPEDVVVGAGDSGSPLSEPGGKIAGILCYGYYGNNRLFLARAIEDVLAVGSSRSSSGIAKKQTTESYPAVPLGCAYVLSGYSSLPNRSLQTPDRIQNILQQVSVQNAGNARHKALHKKAACTVSDGLLPGMSIAIDEVIGDVVNFYAVGTISYIQQKRLFAFGHGYWVEDNSYVNKPVGIASMRHMIETRNRSFKLAERTGTQIGSFTRDDHDAILITRDTVAPTIGLTTNITVHDAEAVQYSHRISYDLDKDFEEWLVRFTTMSSMDKCLNNHLYWGNGKADVTISVSGNQFDTTVACTSRIGYPDSTAREASFSRIDDHEDLTAELTDRIVDFVYSRVENPFTLRSVTITAGLKPDTIPGYHRYDNY